MNAVRYIVGDSLSVLRDLPDGSVDLVVCSPPFLALRAYLPPDHPDKEHEMGSEPTPGAFVDALLDVVEECRRVLTPHGSLAIELGDTYAGCVDEDTEALTDRGWVRYDTLKTGDRILTLNPHTYLAEWGEVEHVNIWAAAQRRMLQVGGSGHSSLTTADHRWYAEARRQTGHRGTRRFVREVVTSDALTSEHRIPTAAPVANLPVEPKWSDALVELVAWYWTEGHDRKPGVDRREETGVYIVQSHRVNPLLVERIDASLRGVFGQPVERLPGVKGGAACWRRDIWDSDPHKTEFRLSAAAARVLRAVAPDRVPLPGWLASLTWSQLRLFIDTAVAADGHSRRGGTASLAQKDRRRADAFQMACILAGDAASLTRDENGDRWCVEVRRHRWLKPIRHPHEWVWHNGLVWCPTTNNGSWLARRQGQVFFTGNSGGAGGDYGAGGLRDGQQRFDGSASKAYRLGAAPQPPRDRWRFPSPDPRSGAGGEWPLDKSLCLVPELVRLSLAYGCNPLTGRQTERWRIRNVVRWARPNPPVGALGDKYRPSTSDILIACTSGRRWFDLDAVRTPSDYHRPNLVGNGSRPGGTPNGQRPNKADHTTNPNGAPPLDTWWHDDAYEQDAWDIPTQSYKGAHYATWPEALVRPLVCSMCPEKVCRECGEPSRRIVGPSPTYEKLLGSSWADSVEGRGKAARGVRTHHAGQPVGRPHIRSAEYLTLGWTECGCGPGCSPTTWKPVTVPAYYLDGKLITAERTVTVVDDLGSCDGSHWRPGVVLDPFAGTGTTLKVAVDLGRDAIGIDIDERNLPQARERVGLRLGMEWHEEVHRPQVVTR